jgi:hypothetical protein
MLERAHLVGFSKAIALSLFEGGALWMLLVCACDESLST